MTLTPIVHSYDSIAAIVSSTFPGENPIPRHKCKHFVIVVCNAYNDVAGSKLSDLQMNGFVKQLKDKDNNADMIQFVWARVEEHFRNQVEVG